MVINFEKMFYELLVARDSVFTRFKTTVEATRLGIGSDTYFSFIEGELARYILAQTSVPVRSQKIEECVARMCDDAGFYFKNSPFGNWTGWLDTLRVRVQGGQPTADKSELEALAAAALSAASQTNAKYEVNTYNHNGQALTLDLLAHAPAGTTVVYCSPQQWKMATLYMIGAMYAEAVKKNSSLFSLPPYSEIRCSGVRWIQEEKLPADMVVFASRERRSGEWVPEFLANKDAVLLKIVNLKLPDPE